MNTQTPTVAYTTQTATELLHTTKGRHTTCIRLYRQNITNFSGCN